MIKTETLKKIHCDTFGEKFIPKNRIVTTDMEAHLHIGNAIADMINNDDVKYIIIQKFK